MMDGPKDCVPQDGAPRRVAVICDLIEENWPSMDLVADMLLKNLHNGYSEELSAARVQPRMARWFGHIPKLGRKRIGFNADRFVNRFWHYPRLLSEQRDQFDIFHIIDHSYAHLALELPGERTIVTCHDLDAFGCLLDPARDRRGRAFKAMTKRILDGFRKAALITCDSAATRDELLKYSVVPRHRLTVVPNGVHPSCSPDPDPLSDAQAERLLGPISDGAVDILHVGSVIKRKRIDTLVEVFALVVKEFPQARLIRVGGQFTAEQIKMVEKLGINRSIEVLPFIDREVLAAVYRRAALVLQPSEGEGFGLPVVEAMACGAPVIASDLAVLREVGGEAARFCPVGDVEAWRTAITESLCERADHPDKWGERKTAGLSQAARFSWAEYARKMVGLYSKILH
jgi:glycosyltransferase involved in cell wall biosynthesis